MKPRFPHAGAGRWIPLLGQALAEVMLGLEEQELADAARQRLARAPRAAAE
jgi:hypothetical protein